MIGTIRPTDSDRLVKNKVNGFIITLQDKLLELKPKLMCNGCGRVANNGSSVSQTPLSTTRPANRTQLEELGNPLRPSIDDLDALRQKLGVK